MKDPNYAPVYLALYPQLAEVARSHGYALAVHGSLGRDMDLICVPWVERPSEPAEVVAAITGKFALRCVGESDTTHHGRERWTISVGFGDCQIDLSFMPRQSVPPHQVEADEYYQRQADEHDAQVPEF